MRIALKAIAVLTGGILVAPHDCHAQSGAAVVVSSCGTPPATYVAGQTRTVTQDTTGTLCATGGGGGGSSGGTATAAAPTYTEGATNQPLSLNLSGDLRTIAKQSGTWNTTGLSDVAQGSTTSGQSGALIQGAVTTAAPSYTTAQTSPLSLTTAGLLRVDGSGVTQPVSQATASNLNAQIVGNIASGATDSGNPVKTGGVYNTTSPSLTNGQRGDLQLDNHASLRVALYAANSTSNINSQTPSSDGISGFNTGLSTTGFNLVYNGSTWDRIKGDAGGGQVNQPYALTGSRIQYAAASGGISNTTTAVTMFAAAGAGLRNYVTGVQIIWGALGAATEIAIRDGASGTVIWRGYAGTGGGIEGIDFPVPLKGSANTLMEVVTLTATVTGGVYVNAQGYTAP